MSLQTVKTKIQKNNFDYKYTNVFFVIYVFEKDYSRNSCYKYLKWNP